MGLMDPHASSSKRLNDGANNQPTPNCRSDKIQESTNDESSNKALIESISETLIRLFTRGSQQISNEIVASEALYNATQPSRVVDPSSNITNSISTSRYSPYTDVGLSGQFSLENKSSFNYTDHLPEITYPLEALSEPWQTFLIILYSLTALTSVVLNVITVIVLSRCRRTELRKYLINLSMSDLLMSLFSIREYRALLLAVALMKENHDNNSITSARSAQ